MDAVFTSSRLKLYSPETGGQKETHSMMAAIGGRAWPNTT
jgi:hypothetical protein